jgi:hypothetical protein
MPTIYELSGSNYSETDASNNNASPAGMPEGMAPSGVNDSWRAGMGAIKRFWGRINGAYASTTTLGNDYALSPTVALAAYVTGERYTFRANAANTASATLNISSLGAKTIKKMTAAGKADLASGDIQSGQSVTAEYDGTDLVLVTPTANTVTDAVYALPHGGCRLTLSSGSLKLSPCNGNKLIVNGVVCTVPDAGVTLAATGLTAGTTYFIYATASAGAINALEASTTGHAASTTAGNKGVEVKSGDDSRTLVGMARVVTGPAFADSATQRLVVSYFNRRGIGGVNAFTASKTTASTTYAELSSSEGRVEFMTWGDEAVHVGVSGSAFNATDSATTNTSLGFDGTTAEETFVQTFTPPSSGGINSACSLSLVKNGLSEGYHYATILGLVTTGTGNWLGTATVGKRTAITFGVRG